MELILTLAFGILGFVLLHKVFDIAYFGFGGIIAEIVGCFFFGIIMSTLAVAYKLVSSIVLLVCAAVAFKKNPIISAGAVILWIIILFYK